MTLADLIADPYLPIPMLLPLLSDSSDDLAALLPLLSDSIAFTGRLRSGQSAIYVDAEDFDVSLLPDHVRFGSPCDAPDPAEHLRLRPFVNASRDLAHPLDASIFGTKDRLVARYGSTALLYVPNARDFARWSGQRWEIGVSGQELYERYASEVAQEASRATKSAKRLPKESPKKVEQTNHAKRLKEYAAKLKTNYHYSAVKHRLAEERKISCKVEDFDATTWEINTPAGIIDLRTGSIHAHDPKRLHSRITRIVPESIPTPRFNAFLDQVLLEDEELATYLQQRIGSALVGANVEQIGVIVHGEHGRGGKSVLFDLLSWCLGDYAAVTSPDTFMGGHFIGSNRDDLASLSGVRMVTTSEPDDEGVIDVASFKRMTGDAIISAAPKYERTRRFAPSWIPFILCNNFPALKQVGNPIWQRIEVVPFDLVVRKDQRDPVLLATLKQEAQGILQWMIDGCIAWCKAGCKIQPLPKRVQSALQKYKTDVDSVRAFVLESCRLVTEVCTSATVLYASYSDFAEARGFRPVSQRSFGLRIGALALEASESDHQISRTRLSDGRIGYRGLRLV